MMNFHDWINEKFVEWRGNSRKGVSEFAVYLGISQPTVSAWLNKSRGQPTSQKIIDALYDKFPEAYEILGLTHTPDDELVGLSPIKQALIKVARALPDEDLEKIMPLLEEREQFHKQHPTNRSAR